MMNIYVCRSALCIIFYIMKNDFTWGCLPPGLIDLRYFCFNSYSARFTEQNLTRLRNVRCPHEV